LISMSKLEPEPEPEPEQASMAMMHSIAIHTRTCLEIDASVFHLRFHPFSLQISENHKYETPDSQMLHLCRRPVQIYRSINPSIDPSIHRSIFRRPFLSLESW
jgi:hypothetical protein